MFMRLSMFIFIFGFDIVLESLVWSKKDKKNKLKLYKKNK